MQPTPEESTEKRPKSSTKNASGKPKSASGKRRNASRRQRQDVPRAPKAQPGVVMQEEREEERPERHRRPTTSTTAQTPARRAKRSKKTKTDAGATGVLDAGSDVSEPIAAQLSARDLGSLATTSKQMHKQFGNVLDRMLWRAIGKPKNTKDCGDKAFANIAPELHKAYFTALQKYERQNFSYVHDAWLKKNTQVRAAYDQFAVDNRLKRAAPAPTPQNLYYVLNRMFPYLRLSTRTPIGVQRAKLATLANNRTFEDSPLRDAVAEFLKLNPDIKVKSVDDLADLGSRTKSDLDDEHPITPKSKAKVDWHWSKAGWRFERQLRSKCPWLTGDVMITLPLGDAKKDAKSDDLRQKTAKVLADLITTDQASVLAFLKNDKSGTIKIAKLRQCVRDAIDTKYANDKKRRNKLKGLVPK